MERWSGRVAIVTGASSGVGEAVARILVKHGMKVVGCARNIEKIQELAESLSNEKGSLLPVKCDMTKEDEVLNVIQRTREEYGGVDVCINSAGVAHMAPLLSGETEQWRNMMEVNVIGVAVMTREVVKDMKERGVDDGHIINMNSLSGHRVRTNSSHTNFYAATKFALTAMTEGVRTELRHMKSKIRVSQISMGVVFTEFQQRLRCCPREEEAKRMLDRPHMEADDIADVVVYQLSAPPNVQVHDILVRPTESLL